MGLVDYHVHTPLCGHAHGEPAAYVARAIDAGLSEIGFSDHAPLPAGLREGITMLPEETERYLAMIEGVRDEFRGRMPVRIGFEVDYPLHDTFDRRYLTDPRIDYLMGSCHFVDGWAFDHPDGLDEYNRRDVDEVYAAYYGTLARLADAGCFDIVGHFDLVKKFGHRATRDHHDRIRPVLAALARAGTAVEISTAGLRKPVGEIYPAPDIVALLFEMNVPITLGSDAHAPEEVAYEFARAVALVRRAGFRRQSRFEKRTRHDIEL